MTQTPFYLGRFYHIFNKSIANFKIFKYSESSYRFVKTLSYYNSMEKLASLSTYLKTHGLDSIKNPLFSGGELLKIIAYCVMPDHYHILIQDLQGKLPYHYINSIENSFTRFLNIKMKRKGPLWQSSYKHVLVESNAQLLHISRYIHLNPVTAHLVDNPIDWRFSSYKDYLNPEILKRTLTAISIKNSRKYQQFVENRIAYQRKLRLIKKKLLE